MKCNYRFACLMLLSIGSAGSSLAALVATIDTDLAPITDPAVPAHTPHTPPNPPFNPSSTDLLTGLSPTLVNPDASLYTRELAGGAGVLNDGSITTVYPEGGPGGDAIDHAPYATLGENELVIWDLGGKFNLTSAVVYGGWNDGGRDQTFFGFDVSSDGVNFTQLIALNANAAHNAPISHRLEITNDAGLYIATGVTHVRLDPGGVENGYTGYTEVDVFGVRVPEPSTFALLALAGVSLLVRKLR
ncbi:PEP-CTERM sorting domain-containing protein [Aeoliella sp. SH292]|uniref:PEP-CTERM sorting domain-containing protein n=1 Tax=Aeoliella sp. SH292 TaxID=3454464 RepID=UPI003F9C3535